MGCSWRGGAEVAEIVYRACEVADIQAVLDLWERAEVVPRPTDHELAMQVRLRRDRDLFQVALDGRLLVGALIGGWDGWRGNMYRLAVDPSYRRRGIGEELVRRVEASLRDLGAVRITSLVLEHERHAVAFWEDQGYTLEATMRRYYKNLS